MLQMYFEACYVMIVFIQHMWYISLLLHAISKQQLVIMLQSLDMITVDMCIVISLLEMENTVNLILTLQ